MNVAEKKVRQHKLVEEVSDERNNDSGIWAYLKPGYKVYDDYHQVHEDTWSEVLSVLRSVEKCDCADCKKYLT